MKRNGVCEQDETVEISVIVPGRIPMDLRLPLRGTARALQELFVALAQCSRAPEIEVTGASCCWTFSQDGTRVHLLVDREE